jgi:hypothetical protein
MHDTATGSTSSIQSKQENHVRVAFPDSVSVANYVADIELIGTDIIDYGVNRIDLPLYQ